MIEKEILEKKEVLLEKMKDSKIKILNIEESINKLLNEKKSIARFGDGELETVKINIVVSFTELGETMVVTLPSEFENFGKEDW